MQVNPYIVRFLGVGCLFVSGCTTIVRNPTIRSLENTRMIRLCRSADEQPFDDRQMFIEEGILTTELGVIGMIVGALENSEDVADYPLVGHLTHLVFLDGKHRPIALLSLILHDCIVTVDPCTRHNKGLSVPFTRTLGGRLKVRSDLLVSYVYQHLMKHNSDGLMALQQKYEAMGINIESALFGQEDKKAGTGHEMSPRRSGDVLAK